MKKTALGLLAALLLVGCADSGRESKPASVAEPTTKPATPSATGKSVAETKTTESRIDAEKLFNDTLAIAKMQNKRVMVHLGAPW
ncbi:MAG: hypothetical protein ABL888_20025 [Pirellulaceae bacterium]